MKKATMAALAAVAMGLAAGTACRLTADNGSPAASGGFTLTSPAVKADGVLPVEFTGDGAGISPPLSWKGAPAGTKAYALIMHHIDPHGIVKWYWTLYNIPAETMSLPKGVTGVGQPGNNSINKRAEYAPPHSKGPGVKTYVCTLYALSETVAPDVGPEKITRDVLLGAMKGKVIGSAELKFTYTRPPSAFQKSSSEPPPPGNEPPPEKHAVSDTP
jgi:phosphatidylethanolamine-binding protein (PEBP) family uncharacterized protein